MMERELLRTREVRVAVSLNPALVRQYYVHTWRLYFMEVMDKLGIQRKVTRLRRKPKIIYWERS